MELRAQDRYIARLRQPDRLLKDSASAFDGSDLTGLDGVSFELFMDGTSLGTGLIGDDAFMVTYNDYEISFGYQDDFNLKLNITSSL